VLQTTEVDEIAVEIRGFDPSVRCLFSDVLVIRLRSCPDIISVTSILGPECRGGRSIDVLRKPSEEIRVVQRIQELLGCAKGSDPTAEPALNRRRRNRRVSLEEDPREPRVGQSEHANKLFEHFLI